jgi:hypothetical protein
LRSLREGSERLFIVMLFAKECSLHQKKLVTVWVPSILLYCGELGFCSLRVSQIQESLCQLHPDIGILRARRTGSLEVGLGELVFME